MLIPESGGGLGRPELGAKFGFSMKLCEWMGEVKDGDASAGWPTAGLCLAAKVFPGSPGEVVTGSFDQTVENMAKFEDTERTKSRFNNQTAE